MKRNNITELLSHPLHRFTISMAQRLPKQIQNKSYDFRMIFQPIHHYLSLYCPSAAWLHGHIASFFSMSYQPRYKHPCAQASPVPQRHPNYDPIHGNTMFCHKMKVGYIPSIGFRTDSLELHCKLIKETRTNRCFTVIGFGANSLEDGVLPK